MFIAGTDFNINNMVVNVSGINSGGVDAMYPSGINISNNTINSTSKSVFNRMHGTYGISLSGSVANKSYIVVDNILNGMPEGGIFSYACFTASNTTTFDISRNNISQNEVNTEGYGIMLSGIINGTIDSNTITPIKGRGILIDATNGCTLPNEKGTLNVTVSNNDIGTIGNPLYEIRNAEYNEDALEVAGIRVRD